MPLPSIFTSEQIVQLQDYLEISDDKVVLLKATLCQFLNLHFQISLENIKMGVNPVKSSEILQGFSILVNPDSDLSYDVQTDAKTELIFISELRPMDIDKVKQQCELKKFPLEIKEKSLIIDGDRVRISDRKESLKIISLYRGQNISHEPLHYYNNSLYSDCYIRMPEYDRDGMYALVLNRYAWGMNVCCAYLDLELNQLIYWDSQNFDHPEGIALKKTEDNKNVEIFITNNDAERKIVYSDPEKPPLPLLDNFYESSKWKNLWCPSDFKDLYDYYKFSDQTDKHFNKFIDDLEKQGLEEMIEDCNKAIATFQKIIDCPGSSTKYIFPLEVSIRTYSKANIACCYSKLHDKVKCMQYLKELETDGWEDWQRIIDDKDLVWIVQMDEFKEFIKGKIE